MNELTIAKLEKIVPQFLVLDLKTACDFYVEQLGFRVDFEYEDFYAGVERDGVMIHLKLSDTPDPSRLAKQQGDHLDIYFTVDDIEALYAEYKTRGVKFTQPLQTKPWDMREFVVWDNNGYILYFGQNA